MIPLSTFNMLVAIAIVLAVYSMVDHQNRLYSNIVSAFLSAIALSFLASAITSYAVYDIIAGIQTAVYSPAIGYLLYLISIFMFGYTLFMAYEIIDEQFQMKTLAEKQMDNDGDDDE